jgi:toxin ParE1/3/4
MKLRFTPRAVQDLADHADTIHVRNPSAAQHARAAILQSLQNLVLFPRVGRPLKECGSSSPGIPISDLPHR